MTTTVPGKKKPVRAFDVILISILGVLALITVYPFYNVLILSFSNIAAQAKHTPYMWFWALDLEGYKTIVGDRFFFLSLGNTLFVTIVGTAINMLLSVAGAYVLSKKRLPGRNFLLTLVVIPMLFSGGMIPTYLVMKDYGLINSIWSMILPWAVSSYYVIIMKNYFRSISPSLEEAAVIDGCGPVRTFFLVVLPMMKPTFISVGVLEIMWVWNDFLLPYLVLDRTKYMTIPIVIQYLKGSYGQVDMGATMALILLSILPVIIFYLLCQKHIIKGVAAGAVKG